jgi:hypothetical protein
MRLQKPPFFKKKMGVDFLHYKISGLDRKKRLIYEAKTFLFFDSSSGHSQL